jgi:phytoene dehydrogenase-like protein
VTNAVVIGSGPNGLSAAVTLATAGITVTVLESADTPGGGVRSFEATETGLLHDECSGFHPFALDSVFSRQFDLTKEGLSWAWPEIQYAHPLDHGQGGAAFRSVEQTAAGLGQDKRAWQSMFGPLTERFDTISAEFLQPLAHLPRHPVDLARLGAYASWPAATLARRFRTEEARALWGGVAAHAFRPLNSFMSSAIGVPLGAAAHRNGWPVAVGGSQQIASALTAILERHGGKIITNRRVEHIRELDPVDIVMFDTSPSAAAQIAGDRLPARTRRAGTVHVCGSLAQTASAELEVAAGRMPERPFVLVGQQYLADPGRSRGGLVPIDCYAHVPAGYGGDATQAILNQIERFAPGTRERLTAVVPRPTREIASSNPNFIGGDILTGSKTPFQTLIGPRLALNPYRSGGRGLYLCSAAVPPGPGAHGIGGHLAAKTAIKDLE